jgi:hypothetical protein
MIERLRTLLNAATKTIAAIAIVVFWCVAAVGTTVGTTVGVTALSTAINAVTSTPAQARRYRRRGWRRRGWGGYPYYRRRYAYPYYGPGYGYPYYRRRGWWGWGPRFGIGFGF